ncbi:MAG: 30S ribosomal protein S17 [Candidatus Kerfeldbacteria bacterium]|nr:30S ribosomal protein S17 [Candidatus Kerfeldbacteria bacterium]
MKRSPQRRRLVGTVISVAMTKTAVVQVDHVKTHPKYHKQMVLSRRYLAHDEHQSTHRGDRVQIEETRPRSARKRWRIVHRQ